MCVLMGHPGMRLGVPSRCGNFFCWGNSGWRRWILLNSAILNSDTKICFFPPPSWAESQVWIFARSLSSREQKWDFPNPILRVFPVLLHSLQDPVPAMPGELPTARIVPGKRNFGVLQSQNFLPTRACKWILVNFDEFWWIGAPAFLTHQGLQVNFDEFCWILLDFGGFWLQGELCCAGHGSILRAGAQRNWIQAILQLFFQIMLFLFCSWAQCSPLPAAGMFGSSWKMSMKSFGVISPTPRGSICTGGVPIQYLSPEE